MKIFKRTLYSLLGLLLLAAVALIGVILYAEYSGRRFNPSAAAAMADAQLTDGESRLVYDENGNLAELPQGVAINNNDALDPPSSEDTAGADAAASPNANLTDADVDAPGSDAAAAYVDDTERAFIMDKASNLFHDASCDYAANIAEDSRMEMTTLKTKIMDAGYQPCSNCNP